MGPICMEFGLMEGKNYFYKLKVVWIPFHTIRQDLVRMQPCLFQNIVIDQIWRFVVSQDIDGIGKGSY